MQEIDKEEYVLKAVCDSMVILIPLSSVRMILASDSEELMRKGKGRVTYQGRDVVSCSLAELLKHENKAADRYVILLENEDLEAALYVEEVSEVIQTEFTRYKLPCYLPDYITSDILGCYGMGNQTIAYKIDIMNIINRFYALQEEQL